jgi:hypothetical protein
LLSVGQVCSFSPNDIVDEEAEEGVDSSGYGAHQLLDMTIMLIILIESS